MNRIRPVSLGAALALAPFVVGCSPGANTAASETSVETLANGAVLVRNSGPGAWAAGEGWRLVEELRIGAVEGPGPDVFGSLFSLSLAVDGEGRMFVLDGQSREVRVFDASGAHVRTFGRAGAGPGELAGGSLAGFAPDGNLWIADPSNTRFSLFSPSGEFLSSFRRDISFSMSPWPGGLDGVGRIYDLGIRDGTAFEHVLIRVDPGNAAADTFPLPNHSTGTFDLLNAAGLPMRRMTIPFSGQLVWRIDPRGYVWSSVTDRYRIVKQTLDGDTVMIVEHSRTPERVLSEERASALEAEHLKDFITAGGRVDPGRIPSTKPLLHTFTVDERGYLWVLSTVGEEAGYDVFEPTGRYLGRVPASERLAFLPLPVFTGNHVYGFAVDDLNVAYLVRLRVEGRTDAGL